MDQIQDNPPNPFGARYMVTFQNPFSVNNLEGVIHRGAFVFLLPPVSYMGVSKNSGIPKWMVKIMENPIKMDDLGVPLFLETPIYGLLYSTISNLRSL